MVGVAQLVEHLNVAQEVAGSSPVTHPSLHSCQNFFRRGSGFYFLGDGQGVFNGCVWVLDLNAL